MLISICIATYQRPKLLIKLLDSISQLEIPFNVEIETIVVDNDSDISAKEVVDEYLFKEKLKLSYFEQPIKNISITRNLAISKANGELIAFIDDDEVASNLWIFELYQTLVKYNADGVFGKVTSYFLPNTPHYIKNCFIYNRPVFESGTSATVTRSGNCMIKTSLLLTLDGPFEPAYGVIGGEDTKLFSLLLLRGARFINCKEAETFEFVPPERANLKWLIRRSFRTANGYVRRTIELTENLKLLIRIKFLLIGLLFLLTSILLLLLFFPIKSKRIHWYLKAVANFGKILAVFGYHPTKYA